MSFFAGITNFNGLDTVSGERFNKAVLKFCRNSPWPVEYLEDASYMLAHSSPSDMWDGPRIISEEEYLALAIGTQWRRTQSGKPALEYLSDCFLNGAQIEDMFDYFSIAVIDKKNRRAILATDPIGIGTLAYLYDNGSLVFSSHQYFLRLYLGSQAHVCLDAVFEYLLLRYILGEKTLLENVRMLEPGSRLHFSGSRLDVAEYARIDDVKINSGISLEEACEKIWNHLDRKFKGYISLTKKDFAVPLSGGWDSRLIAGFLARYGRLRETFTSEQRLMMYGRHVVEGRMAKQVSRFLGVKNSYIKLASSQSPSAIRLRMLRMQRMVDFSTTFHSWALDLADHLPQDEYILTDGLMGSMLLTASRHIADPAVQHCVEKNDRQGYAHLIMQWLTQGLGPIQASSKIQYPDLKSWKKVLEEHYVSTSVNNLLHNIGEALAEITSDNFVTMFTVRTRAHRSLKLLSTNIFGSKGAVITPFCDPEYLRLTLTMPLKMKRDKSLHRCLLEKTKRGLSEIPSTHTEEEKTLRPYLKRNFFSSYEELFLFGLNHVPQRLSWHIWRSLAGIGYLFPQTRAIVDEAIVDPPTVLAHLLAPNMREAIKKHNRRELAKYAYHLQGILLLERFFGAHAAKHS